MDKEALERKHAEMMNQQAVERIKAEVESSSITKEQAEYEEKVFFEDDEEVTLRDGKKYKIRPFTLKEARRFMEIVGNINVDAVLLNFIPTGDPEVDKKRQDMLFEVLGMAFKDYPHVDRDYIDSYVDVVLARDIITIMMGLNGLKK